MAVRKNKQKKPTQNAALLQTFRRKYEMVHQSCSTNVGHDTASPQTQQTTKKSFFDDFSHKVFSFCKLFNTPLVKKVKYKEQVINEICRINMKIKSLVEFILSDPTVRAKSNLGCYVQNHSKKLLSQEKLFELSVSSDLMCTTWQQQARLSGR